MSLNVMGMIGLSCYILADTFFVSKGLGTDGLAALNLAIPIYSFIHGSGPDDRYGRGEPDIPSAKAEMMTRRQTGRSPLPCIWQQDLPCFLCCWVCLPREQSCGCSEHRGGVYEMSNTYLQVILLFAPAFLMNNVLLCFTRNDGAPQRAMAAMIGGSLSNVVLDWVFIFPCGMGIFGAVFATGLAPIISMMILSPHILKKRNGFHFARCLPQPGRVGKILSSGRPSLVTEASSGIVMIVFNFHYHGVGRKCGVAAYGVIANLSLVIIAVVYGNRPGNPAADQQKLRRGKKGGNAGIFSGMRWR